MSSDLFHSQPIIHGDWHSVIFLLLQELQIIKQQQTTLFVPGFHKKKAQRKGHMLRIN